MPCRSTVKHLTLDLNFSPSVQTVAFYAVFSILKDAFLFLLPLLLHIESIYQTSIYLKFGTLLSFGGPFSFRWFPCSVEGKTVVLCMCGSACVLSPLDLQKFTRQLRWVSTPTVARTNTRADTQRFSVALYENLRTYFRLSSSIARSYL